MELANRYNLFESTTEVAPSRKSHPKARTMLIACDATFEAGNRIGDMITMAHAARLIAESEPHEQYIITLNPKHPLNFVFDKVISDFEMKVVLDDWALGRPAWEFPEFEKRRIERVIEGIPFQTYKELYRRIDGGHRQNILCGGERGLGRRNIFEYYFFGQESSLPECQRGADFGPESFGWRHEPTAPEKSVFLAPHAHSQGNDIFTMQFWSRVIQNLLQAGICVMANTPVAGLFGHNAGLTYSFQHDDFKALFRQVAAQRLVLCGNTGIGWIAGAHGVPLIAGEPSHFWFMDYRYREAGVRSVAGIFARPDPDEVANRVLLHFDLPSQNFESMSPVALGESWTNQFEAQFR